MSKKKCYRIVRDIFAGYEVQVKKRFLFFTWWWQCNQQGGINTFLTIDRAKQWIEDGLPKTKGGCEVWISEGCKNK